MEYRGWIGIGTGIDECRFMWEWSGVVFGTWRMPDFGWRTVRLRRLVIHNALRMNIGKYSMQVLERITLHAVRLSHHVCKAS